MTRVKICGITRDEDAQLCAELGVDYLGFVFVTDSARSVDPVECGGFAAAFPRAAEPLDAHVSDSAAQGKAAAALPHSRPLRVGVFRDSPLDELLRIAKIARLDMIQLHGSEPEEYVRAIGLPVIKVVDVTEPAKTNAPFVMFDSGGGTGRTFDWSLVERHRPAQPFFLAGGLTPGNVAEAIRVTLPYAVDVSSGVEACAGVKDHQKLRDFVNEVRQP